MISYILERDEPRLVVEIGTCKGGTLWLWCQLAAEDALVVSIDLPGGPFGGGYTNSDIGRFSTYPTDPQKLKLLLGDSHHPDMLEALKKALGGREIDLLFIDGDHTLDGVTKDWQMYAPLVKDGGIVLFHDVVDHSSSFPDCQVKPLWDELKTKYESEEFVAPGDWGGIGVLVYAANQRGEEVSGQRQALPEVA